MACEGRFLHDMRVRHGGEVTLSERYAPGTAIGRLEGRPLNYYYAFCSTCKQEKLFETRAVADADHDAEIEVCVACGTVAKFARLR